MVRFCKPSQLLALMLSVCPSGIEIQPVFLFLFLLQLPQKDSGNIRNLVALVDRLGDGSARAGR